MMKKSYGEDVVCLICDYGWVILGVLAVITVGLWQYGLESPPGGGGQAVPLSQPTSVVLAPTLDVPTHSPPVIWTPTVFYSTSTPFPLPTLAAVPKSEYIIAFIPVNWVSSKRQFDQMVDAHASIFIQKSQIQEYFDVKVVKMEEGINLDLNNESSLIELLDFGLSQSAADRYIGLTESNIALNGVTEITGYSFGPGFQAVVAESEHYMVTAHELGHTFGLCDEYNYSVWVEQNSEFEEQCPNPFPPPDVCAHTSEELCPGYETADGKNSLMGPSGLEGEYAFNDACLSRLKSEFEKGITSE